MIGLADPAALLWLAALPPALAAAAWAARRRRADAAAFGGGAALRRGRSRWRRPLRLLLLLGALALIAIAIARPQWGEQERTLTRRGIDIAIALDVSRSMTADDAAPTRAGAAAAALGELLDHLPGDRAGLVTFAGGAFERSPLTLDFEPLRQLIARAQRESALVPQGTDLAAALEAALRLLDVEDAAATQAIVLISDGEHLAGDLGPALRQARARGVRVHAAAAGTAGGGAMAARERADGGTGGGAADADGARSRADRETLRRIAEATGGELRELDALPGLAVGFRRLRQSEFDEGTDRAPIDRFQWFLGAALALLAARELAGGGWRLRRAAPPSAALPLTASALLAALIAACGSAEYRRTGDGHAAYADGRYGEALAAYRESAALAPAAPQPPYNIGNALHRLGRYEEATAASSEAAGGADDPALHARALYALGSHAFRRGDLEAAREAWIGVLLLDPGDRDAKHNLELTLRLLRGEDPAPPPDAADPGGQQDRADGQPDSSAHGQPGGGSDGQPDSGANGQPGGGDGQPDSGANGQPGGGGDGQPGSGAPGDQAGAPGAGGQPSPSGSRGDGASSDRSGAPGGLGTPGAPRGPSTLDEAQAQLSAAVLRLGDEALGLADALALLDLVRTANALDALDPRGNGGGGGLPDR